MKLTSVAAIAVLTFTTAGHAQDTFTGFYVGVGADTGLHQETSSNLSARVNGADVLDPHATGATNLFAGYTTDLGIWVVGGEAELSLFSIDFSEADCRPPLCADAYIIGTRDNAIRVRAIAGQALTEDTLLFATAGLTASQYTYRGVRAVTNLGMGLGGASNTGPEETGMAYGFNIGVGAEHRVTERFSFRGDVSFERVYVTGVTPQLAGSSGSVAGNTVAARAFLTDGSYQMESVRFGVSAVFRF
ncbi:outer membrane protein [Jannaschia sp. CCS1]|uniref:outer membrane protein n=1 Tax=Jannaschia sp. (strain CCS1) TaxID=290400 RepID=UPI000053B3F6|nr:outer membrane beta-barrel protein [Jannaschia sp. CCS1]ABD57011.1 hypothetical protein Jann_4094 [Jannaschia sp. CCS1]